MSLQTLATAYAMHHQFVLQILQHNGRNEFLNKSGDRYFKIRHTYLPSPDGNGLCRIDESEGTKSSVEGTVTQLLMLKRIKVNNMNMETYQDDEEKQYLQEIMILDDIHEDVVLAWNEYLGEFCESINDARNN